MVSKICPCRIVPNVSESAASDHKLLAYSDCCEPLHQGNKRADTSEDLMRSRYSAFVMVLTDYIVKTTVPAQQALLDTQAIEAWAEQTRWAGLEVIKHSPKVDKRHAQVEFKAYYYEDELGSPRLSAHHELSTFVKIKDSKASSNKQATGESWYFLDPTVTMTLTQKQPCVCGSGEKFKRCCGPFI